MADHYQAKHGKSSAGSVIVKVLIIVLIVAVFAAGAWAVWNFVLNAEPKEEPTEAVPTVQNDDDVTFATLPPTEAPTESEDEKAERLATDYMKNMTLDEKIAQLFIVRPEVLTGLDPDDPATIAGDMTKEALEKTDVGGVIYFSQNIEDASQINEMIRKTQSFSKTPLFIAVDEEGGDVARIANNDSFNVTALENMYSYKDKGAQTAHDNAETIGKYLLPLGFNLDFAPVADVWSNAENTVIGERAYSDDYEQAAELVAGAVEGFHDAGVMSTLKHFPGHGDTAEDSHEELAVINKTADELKAAELLPFKAGIDAGADMVMVGHLMVPSMDENLPATLSATIVPTLLRQELGFDGIAVSDSLMMSAVADNFTVDEIVKGLFKADIDLFLDPENLDAYFEAINAALESGDITETDIETRVVKILKLKFKYGLLTETAVVAATEAAQPATDENGAAVTADAALTSAGTPAPDAPAAPDAANTAETAMPTVNITAEDVYNYYGQ